MIAENLRWRRSAGDNVGVVASLPSSERAFPRHAVDAAITLARGGEVVARIAQAYELDVPGQVKE